MSTTMPQIETETSEWFEIEVSFWGQDDWFSNGTETFDSLDAVQWKLATFDLPGYERFKFRMVKVVQTRTVVDHKKL